MPAPCVYMPFAQISCNCFKGKKRINGLSLKISLAVLLLALEELRKDVPQLEETPDLVLARWVRRIRV